MSVTKSYKSANRHTRQEVYPIKAQSVNSLLLDQFVGNEKQQLAPPFEWLIGWRAK